MNEKPSKSSGGIVIAILVVILVAFLTMCSSGGGGGSSSKTCRSCGRSFSSGSNLSSIKKTGMCTNCYGNYSWAKSAFD